MERGAPSQEGSRKGAQGGRRLERKAKADCGWTHAPQGIPRIMPAYEKGLARKVKKRERKQISLSNFILYFFPSCLNTPCIMISCVN